MFARDRERRLAQGREEPGETAVGELERADAELALEAAAAAALAWANG